MFCLFNLAFAQSKSEQHRLVLKSDWDFILYLNDYYVYEGNVFDTTLVSGNYKLEAYLSSQTSKLTIFKSFLELNSDTLIYFNQIYPFKLRTRPEDSRVLLDSFFIGYTPLNINLLFRPKLLAIQNMSFGEKNFNISNYDKYDFEFEFKDENKLTQKKENLFNLKYVSLASTIVTGVLSAYYKQLANKFYHKENRTQDDLNRVNKYDKISAIFTVGLEISFGIFVYALFNE
jgi:hypothetical protein